MTTAQEILLAMEHTFRRLDVACAEIHQHLTRPLFLRVNRLMRTITRELRGPKQQLGGCGARAIKRRTLHNMLRFNKR